MTGEQTANKPTLREVAREAGVSTYSASRALSGADGVSEATRERVRQAARDVGYVANQLARSLKGKSSRTIGILAAGTSNEYYATLIGAFDHTLRSAGFQSFLADSMVDGAHDPQRETNLVGAMLEQRVAAVVVTYSVAASNLRLITEWGIPLIFVDCVPPPGYADYPSVTCDNEHASRLVGEHFAQHGYRRWVFVGYPALWSTRAPRQRGFTESAEQVGASVDVVEAGNDSATAHHAMARYLAARPGDGVDAIYCANTPLLQGTLRAIREDGREVGQDLGVVSFDEFQWAELVQPPITVVDQGITDIGHEAATRLLLRLDAGDRNQPSEDPRVNAALVVRRSCGCTADTERREGPSITGAERGGQQTS